MVVLALKESSLRSGEAKEKNDILRVFFEVSSPYMAEKILAPHSLDGEIIVRDNGIELSASREQITEISNALLNEGIKIYEIRTIRKSLEDQFLEMTGGDQIVKQSCVD